MNRRNFLGLCSLPLVTASGMGGATPSNNCHQNYIGNFGIDDFIYTETRTYFDENIAFSLTCCEKMMDEYAECIFNLWYDGKLNF